MEDIAAAVERDLVAVHSEFTSSRDPYLGGAYG